METNRICPKTDFWKVANELMGEITPKDMENQLTMFFQKKLYNKNEMQWFKLCCIQAFLKKTEDNDTPKKKIKEELLDVIARLGVADFVEGKSTYEKDATTFIKDMFPGNLFFVIDRTIENEGYNPDEALFFKRLLAEALVLKITTVILKTEE